MGEFGAVGEVGVEVGGGEVRARERREGGKRHRGGGGKPGGGERMRRDDLTRKQPLKEPEFGG